MKQVCVIGLGQFGTHLARSLVRMGCEVQVIDVSERNVNAVRDDVHRAIIGDVRDYEMLAGVVTASIDDVIVSLGEASLEPSILCTLNLKRIGVKRIRATAVNDDHAQILRAVGATEVIFPERDAAGRVARLIASPDIHDMFPLDENFRILEVDAPPKTHGKSLADLDLRSKHDLLVIATRGRGEEHFRFLPAADQVIKEGEVLMVVGLELDLARFAAMG